MPIASNLIVKMSADVADLKAGMTTAKQDMVSFASSVKSAMPSKGLMDFAALTTGINQALGLFGKLQSAVSAVVTPLIEASDKVQMMTGRLLVVSDGAVEAGQTLNDLYDIGQRTRTSWEANVDLFGRMARSLQALGKSRTEMLTFTETVQKAARISGASAQEAAAGVQQLGQALASGRLSGDELRSIIENFPRLAQAIAEGLGVSIGQLREMGSQGTLTADKVFTAVQKAVSGINNEFAKLPATTAESMQMLADTMDKTISFIDQKLGASKNFKAFIDTINEALKASVERAQELKSRLVADLEKDLARQQQFLVNARKVLETQRTSTDPGQRAGVKGTEENIAGILKEIDSLERRLQEARGLKKIEDDGKAAAEAIKQLNAAGMEYISIAGQFVLVDPLKAVSKLGTAMESLGVSFSGGGLVARSIADANQKIADFNKEVDKQAVALERLGVNGERLKQVYAELTHPVSKAAAELEKLGQEAHLSPFEKTIAKAKEFAEVLQKLGIKIDTSAIDRAGQALSHNLREAAEAQAIVDLGWARLNAAAGKNPVLMAQVNAQHKLFMIMWQSAGPETAMKFFAAVLKGAKAVSEFMKDDPQWATLLETLTKEATVTATAGLGAGVADEIKKAEKDLARLREQLKAVGQFKPGQNLDEFNKALEKQFSLREKLDEIDLRLAKGEVTKQQAERLKDLARSASDATKSIEQLRDAQARGVEMQRTYGDSTKEVAETIKKIREAVAGGFLTPLQGQVAEFFENKKIKQRMEEFQDQVIEMTHGKGVLDAVNGLGDAFKNMGSDVYDAMFQADGSVKEFVASTLKNLGKMVFQMLVWTPIIEAFMRLIKSWLTPTSGLAGAGAAAGGAVGTVGTAGARQGGGPVWPNTAFWVGEHGPERFVPSVPGTIEPAGGGGDNINIAIDARGVVTDAQDPARAAELGRRMKAAVLDVLRNEKRPGGMLSSSLVA